MSNLHLSMRWPAVGIELMERQVRAYPRMR